MRQEGMDVARIIEIVLGVTCIEESSPPGPRDNRVNTYFISTCRQSEKWPTRAGRPRRSTCPGTENRLPGGEPFGKPIISSYVPKI